MKKTFAFTFSVSHLLKAVFALFLLTCCASCSCYKFSIPCICNGGRPPVLVSQATCVIDYNDCFEEFYVGQDAECLRGVQKQPLTPDMYDPYLATDPGYRLALGDILEISVFGEDETTVDNAMIAPDGKIYYTVLEGVPAAGRTPSELAEDLASKLEHLFLNPIVTVVPKTTKAQNYRILGRVRAPGEYLLEGPVSLREAIGEAGGAISSSAKGYDVYNRGIGVPFVDLSRSFIVRDNKKLDVDFSKLLLTSDNTQNIYLRPNDYIYIAPTETKEVFVLGYVLAPQRVPFLPDMTLMSVLATAGGWPPPSPYSPDLQRILIIRGSLECPKVCEVDLRMILAGRARDVYLMPGDIVYASHKSFRFGRELIHLAIDSFIYSFVWSAAVHYSESHWFLEGVDDD
ncbi:MAG: polysaccharide biosynthesis/export family protein [Waddliaceae bacterium]